MTNIVVGLSEETKKAQVESLAKMKSNKESPYLLKPENVLVCLQNPVRTGMMLALGFFLMGIILSIVGYIFIGASCAAIMGQLTPNL